MNTTYSRRTFLQQLSFGLASISLSSASPSFLLAAASSRLPRSLPEAQAVSSQGILDFVNAIESQKLSLHSLMVLRHGHVLAEGWWAPYAPHLRHTLYSLSKSFTSSAIGLAVAEGRLKLDDKVISFFPDDLPATITPNLASMRVRDLLTMSSGHSKCCLLGGSPLPADPNWVKSILAKPVDHEPGTFFAYNSGATYLLSAILQKITGQTLLTYLQPRLLAPLGIENADSETDPRGIHCGGWGLRVKTEDIACFGQLYLQKGLWNGKPILPESWVADATRAHIQSKGGGPDWQQGYGYQFWRCQNGAFRGDGAYGQYCIVLPAQDAVIAITSELGNMQAVLNNVWTHLLPAMSAKTLSPDTAAQAQLTRKLASLTLPLPPGQPASPTAARVHNKTFTIADNTLGVKCVTLAFQKDQCLFTMRDAHGEHRVACGLGRWLNGETDVPITPLKLVATSVPGEKQMKAACAAAWSDENTFVMHWRFIETAHYQSVTCRFTADRAQLEFKRSVSIMNRGNKDPRPLLEGRL